MNPRSEWFKRNTQSESIRRIPTSDSWGLKDWSGFIRIQSLGLTRIETDWFLTELHQTRLKTYFGLTRMSSEWRGHRFRNKSDWFGMNFNPKLLPGRASLNFNSKHSETLSDSKFIHPISLSIILRNKWLNFPKKFSTKINFTISFRLHIHVAKLWCVSLEISSPRKLPSTLESTLPKTSGLSLPPSLSLTHSLWHACTQCVSAT